MEAILNLLTKQFSVDFKRCKHPTIQKKIERRMNALNIEDVNEYYTHISENTIELENLFSLIPKSVSEKERTLLCREHLSSFFDSTLDCISIYDENLNLIDINKSGLLKGKFTSKESIIGKNILEISSDPLISERIKIYRDVIATSKPFVFKEPVKQGKNYLFIQALKVSNGMALVMKNVTELKKTEKALKESNEKLELLVNSVNGIVWECDANTFQFHFVSNKIMSILGVSPELWLEDTNEWTKAIHPDDRDFVLKFCMTETANLRDHEFEYRMYDNNRNIKWIKDVVSVISEDGKPITLRGIMFDITKQKEADRKIEELKETLEQKVIERTSELIRAKNEITVLLQEMHHRVKNNLQVISSLLNLQAADSGDEQVTKILKESQNRIYSMSLIHESLYKNESLSSIGVKQYFEQLIESITENNENDSALITKIKTPELHFQINTMVPLGLLLNELVTNSLKHAFKRRKQRIISVDLKPLKEKNYYQLKYSDNGQGFDTKANTSKEKSLGMELIDCFISQLEGKYEIKSDNKGTKYLIHFREI